MNTIGIDFGTTKTLVSWFDPAKKEPRLVRLGREKDAIPSTVFVAEHGSCLFGDEADDMAEHEASRYCRGFKLGLGEDIPFMMAMVDGVPVAKTALELTAAFLEHVRIECEQKLFMGKEEIRKAQITVPVAFGEAQKEDLRTAAQKAGFEEVTLVLEPEAAGTAFCRMAPDRAFQGTALVVDWGGGTLDMAVVTRESGQVQIHGRHSKGYLGMGGEKIDRLLWDHICRRLMARQNVDLNKAAPEHKTLLLRKIRKVKEDLSLRTVQPVILVWEEGEGTMQKGHDVVERVELETLLETMMTRVSEMVKELLAGCDSKPDMILLIGGTSSMPMVGEKLKGLTGLEASVWEYSREAVGLGAAYEHTIPIQKPVVPRTLKPVEKCLEQELKRLHTFRHEKDIRSVAFSPDGKLALTGSDDNTAKLWDIASGECMHSFQHKSYVYSVAFSPNGKLALTGSWDGTAKLWNVASGECLHTFCHKASGPLRNYIESVAFSPNGAFVLTGSDDHTAKLWDVVSGECLYIFPHNDTIRSVSFSPDGAFALTRSDDGIVNLWGVFNHLLVHTFPHENEVVFAIFSPDSRLVLTRDGDKIAKLWNVASGECLHTFKNEKEIESLTFRSVSELILSGSSDQTTKYWNINSLLRFSTLAINEELASDYSSHPSLWDVVNGKRLHTFHHQKAYSRAFSPDGKLFLTGSWDGTAKLWDLSNLYE